MQSPKEFQTDRSINGQLKMKNEYDEIITAKLNEDGSVSFFHSAFEPFDSELKILSLWSAIFYLHNVNIGLIVTSKEEFKWMLNAEHKLIKGKTNAKIGNDSTD